MTKDTNGSGPDLIVLGRDEAGKPRAARFPTGHDGLVAKAAKAMNLAVCKADRRGPGPGWPRGYRLAGLYSTGRGVAPSVGQSLYGKLVEQLKFAGQPGAGRGRPAGRRSGRRPGPLHRACRPPGTTLPSATW